MPALKDEKREKFCQLIASGRSSPADAYIAAGYAYSSRDSARASASKLLRAPSIEGRIKELAPQGEQAAQEAAQRVLEVVESNIAIRADRLLTYAFDYANLCELQRCRATDPAHQDVVGIKTGVLAVTYEMVGKKLYKVAKYDSAIERDKLAIKKQFAIEMREWTEQTDSKVRFESVEDFIERGAPEQLQAELARLRAIKEGRTTATTESVQ